MMFESLKRAGAFSLAMLLATAAQAATLDAIRGGVLVSRGGAPYQIVGQPTDLRVGDSVIANPGGEARVVFPNGCAIAVKPGMVFAVPESPPCLAEGPPPESAGSGDYTMIAVGAAVVAGGVGIAIAAGGGGGGGSGGGGGGGSP